MRHAVRPHPDRIISGGKIKKEKRCDDHQADCQIQPDDFRHQTDVHEYVEIVEDDAEDQSVCIELPAAFVDFLNEARQTVSLE